MRILKNKGVSNTIQKLRFWSPVKVEPILKTGNCGFFFFSNLRFEFVYLKLLRRRFRIALKRSKKMGNSRRIWLNLKANYPISKKYKNARMGKGKGSFFRWSIRLRPMLCFMEFFGFHPLVLRSVISKSRHWYTSDPQLAVKQHKTTFWADKKKTSYSNTQLKMRLI